MTLVSDAMIFASRAHDGMLRKGTNIPYIVHPAEVAAIAATLTDDPEILAAALLHDVMEDCGVSEAELAERFGARVAQLVKSETQERNGDPAETWLVRKQGAVERIGRGGREVKIIALSDKLSNMRAIHRDYDRDGERLFFRCHQHDNRRDQTSDPFHSVFLLLSFLSVPCSGRVLWGCRIVRCPRPCLVKC